MNNQNDKIYCDDVAGVSAQKPAVVKRVDKTTGKGAEVICSEQGTYKVKLKRLSGDVGRTEKNLIFSEQDDLRRLRTKVDVVESEISGIMEEFKDDDDDDAEYSDSQESGGELDSDISTPESDNDVGMSRSRLKRGSYDLISVGEGGIGRDKVAGTDSEGEFATEEEVTSLSSNYSETDDSNADVNEIKNHDGGVVNVGMCASTAGEFIGGKGVKSGLLVSADREDSPSHKRKDVQKQSSEFSLQKQSSEFSLQKQSSEFSLQKQSSEFSLQKQPSEFSLQKQPSEFSLQKQPSEFSLQKQPSEFSLQKQPSEFSLQKSATNDSKKARTSSYQRACSRESTFSETLDSEQYNEDYVESESDSERTQLDSIEGNEVTEVNENDPHGLIRKPAVRRKGFAWTSKSLPRSSTTTRMKHQQQSRENADSSLELGPSLLTLYDHRLAAGTRGSDNDDDDMIVDAGEVAKTRSLPTRADKIPIDGNQEYYQRESPQRLQTDRQVVLSSYESVGHMVRTAFDDTKKRPLSISSASSNSFTHSPRLRKKKANGVSGDDLGVYMEDMQGSLRTVAADTKVSPLDPRFSVDSGFVQRNKDRDRHSDSMSITSSETDSLSNEAEYNIAKDSSRMSSSASDPLNVSKSNKPLRRPNLNSSVSSPGYKDYSNSSSYVLVALDGQPGTPSSCSEMGHPFPDPQSPVMRAYTKDGAGKKSDNSRHSSRHEARMKFFTNYEEYMSQSSPPEVSNMEECFHVSSESHPSASKKNPQSPPSSSHSLPAKTPESAAKMKDNNTRSHTQSPSVHTSAVLLTPSAATPSESGRDTVPKSGRRSDRTSRRSERRGSNSKHEGFSASSRSGFSRSSKKRDLTASSEAGSRSSQGYTSYVSRVVTEIIESERTYIASLEDIINGYLEPMENILSSSDAKKDIECLFSNIREIYKFGCIFLADLETAGPDCVKVAQCFVKHNKGFVIYTDYCTNYPRAVEVLTRFMQHPELSELCKDRQLALGHGLPLGAYLLRPVQRILKYHLLLQNIVKNCEKEKAETVILEQAFHHMTEMAHHINEMKRKHEHAVRIQEIQSQLEDYAGEDLTRLGELVLEGTFKIYGAKASRQVFLFERGLLICKKNEGGMLSCKAFVLCSNLMLVEVIPNEPLSFHIIPFNNPRAQYTLQARNMEQKRLWCQNIKELILESFKGRIPDNVKNLIMQLGREHDDDYVSKEAMEAGRKNQHTAPEYLEKRKVRGKSGSRIPDFSLLRPQKAKRGGNKKGDVRTEQKSPEMNRRAKSKSPERHRQNLLRQNAAKNRSQSSSSPALPVAALCKLIPNPIQTITQIDDKTAEGPPLTSECTSPESPVYRKSRKFTYSRNDEGESPISRKTSEIPKRPLSFLMARANPILSADLTQLLARCGGSIKMQSPALPSNEENDKINPLHTVIDENFETSLGNSSDTNKDLANEHQHFEEDTNFVQDSKFNETSLSAKYNVEADNETKSTLENDAIEVDNLNLKSLTDTDSESISSLAQQVLETDRDKSCECEKEKDSEKSCDECEKEKDADKLCDECGKEKDSDKSCDECIKGKEINFVKGNDDSEIVEHIYENVNISVDGRSEGQHNEQSFIKDEEIKDISSQEMPILEAETNSIDNQDISSNTTGENELKRKSLRLPNTSQHLLTHENGFPDRVKAKLTNWNSVDKLTKGSMSDVSHVNDDPWVRSSGTTNSAISLDAEPQSGSEPWGVSDASEMMQVSNNKENMDWLVYLNKSSTSLKHQSSSDDKRMSTPILNRHSFQQQSLEAKIKPLPQSSNATRRPENMTYENMKRIGLIKDHSRDESFYQNKRGNNSSTSLRKVNAFGMSPTTITIARPISFSSSGLVRSSSTPISELKDYPVAKAAFKERPASMDIDILTRRGLRVKNEMKDYLRNSFENVKDVNEVPTKRSTTKAEDEEADSNRLSVISSISTSSYESQSSSSEGVVDPRKSKLHEQTDVPKSRPESVISYASTLTSDDEDRDVPPRSGNTFEPPSKNRISWKEDRQLETVLREHSLGSSKLGLRMAQSFSQPAEQVTPHQCSNSSGHKSSICSNDALSKAPDQSDEQSNEDTNFPSQVESLSTTTSKATETIVPSLNNRNLPGYVPESSNLSNESNIQNFVPQRQGTTLDLAEELSNIRTSKGYQMRNKTKTVSESSNFERSESLESIASNDSCYERKLSAAFDSDIFQDMPEIEKRSDRDLKEALLLKKSIREYVKDIEKKFQPPSPKIFEVKRREPGAMIRQRLQTLRESALHGWRNSSISSSKLPLEERVLQHTNYDRRGLYANRDNSLDNNSNLVCLRPSSSRDSLSKSVDNLSKSRDNVFSTRSRDSLSSISMSRDSLTSLSNSPGCRHSAPVYCLKIDNAGHEQDANRFQYKIPEEGQAILGNQFVHRRTYSRSQNSLLESEMQSSLDMESGSVKSSPLLRQQTDPGSETDNLVVMKGWVKSLISKFQVN